MEGVQQIFRSGQTLHLTRQLCGSALHAERRVEEPTVALGTNSLQLFYFTFTPFLGT